MAVFYKYLQRPPPQAPFFLIYRLRIYIYIYIYTQGKEKKKEGRKEEEEKEETDKDFNQRRHRFPSAVDGLASDYEKEA